MRTSCVELLSSSNLIVRFNNGHSISTYHCYLFGGAREMDTKSYDSIALGMAELISGDFENVVASVDNFGKDKTLDYITPALVVRPAKQFKEGKVVVYLYQLHVEVYSVMILDDGCRAAGTDVFQYEDPNLMDRIYEIVRQMLECYNKATERFIKKHCPERETAPSMLAARVAARAQGQ